MASDRGVVVELNDNAEYQRILAGAPQTSGMKAGRVYLEPGKACGEHSTKGFEEILVFLSGRGELQIGQSERLAVGAGKVAYIRPETVHNVVNTGSETLTYIYCVAPAGT